MQIDIHERRLDGGAGRLLDTIDRTPEHRRNGDWIEFDGEIHPVLTGVRPFICLTAERWAQMQNRTTVKKSPRQRQPA